MLGAPLPIHIDPSNIPYGPPCNKELRVVIEGLCNRQAAGMSGLQAKHLSNVVREEMEESDVGLGDQWRIFVKVMQVVWEQGSIPEQMRWEIIILLPKSGSDYCGIGLLEPFWKVAEKIMAAQFASVKFHEGLLSRLSNWGTGTATIEAKLHQSLAWHDQCPLYQNYVDLKKAYNALDREPMLNILVAYGVRPKMLALQKHF